MEKTKMIDNFQEVRSIDNNVLNTSNCLPCGKPKNKLSKICIHPGCKTRSTYNSDGETKALYCSAHKIPGMVNVNDKPCIHPGCITRPNYNAEGETKRLYCFAHKMPGMVDVKNKTCLHPDCKTQPTFNVVSENKPLYCFAHKLDGMVDVINKTCIHPECKTQPTFNIAGETKRLYCSVHKLDGMINVTNKTCIQKDCMVLPSYNKEGERIPVYCFAHKTPEMVDVKSNTCIHPYCKTRPNYNKEGETRAMYCAEHKLPEMVNVKSKTCIHPQCKKQPNYNVEGEKTALYCLTHKKNGMVDVHHKMCKTYLCSTRVQEKYDGYCRFCYINLFPDKPVFRNYKTKEYSVVEYVKSKYPTLTWIADKIINGGCSKRRPDLLLDLGYQIVIVEVDENKHTNYDCSCENKRIMELSQDLGHRPIVFIRFNPDDYITNGITITSCWVRDKTGICVVKKTKKNEWMQRLSALEESINYWIDPLNKTDKTVETIQLFYDV